ncbi:MAG TPA: acetamidase/formamidase family protein [Aggregatilineales bacterium]|nr:acetamidase/formamidase family protein [Aggregatilineales bacterium]
MSKWHILNAERATLHGHFSPDLASALAIDPGDSVRFQCLDGGWGVEPHNGVDTNRREFPGRDLVLDSGHALTGPVLIQGAKPGITLAVRIDAIQVGQWGTTFAGGWQDDLNDRLGISSKAVFHVWTFNHEARTARNQHGHPVTLRPFMGVYGMPPAEHGIHSTISPRATGGNIDCKELVAGSTLYLPIEVDGGLFSVGDGHAVQGDGEVSVTAIECPMDRVDLSFDL